MSERSDLPPRLRNWKEGTPQIGVFIRTRRGSVVTCVNDSATDTQETLVLACILGPTKMPPELLCGLKEWVDSHVKREAV